ncbi:MAG: LysR family transcriptional regulator [Moraxellaceae bacterium]|nr:MAG: LysR family transcriptional regulator [Moraxellaceae bacterium]
MTTQLESSIGFSPIAVRLRLMHQDNIAFGPGKADLLEAIAQSGSISQAAKQMGMSYRRAWQLVDTMNRCFATPLVETQAGGSLGGGTALTHTGIKVLNLFRKMEQELLQQSSAYQQQWNDLLKP